MYKIKTTHQFEKDLKRCIKPMGVSHPTSWLLIWNQYDDELELLMLNTGTHSDLF